MSRLFEPSINSDFDNQLTILRDKSEGVRKRYSTYSFTICREVPAGVLV